MLWRLSRCYLTASLRVTTPLSVASLCSLISFRRLHHITLIFSRSMNQLQPHPSVLQPFRLQRYEFFLISTPPYHKKCANKSNIASYRGLSWIIAYQGLSQIILERIVAIYDLVITMYNAFKTVGGRGFLWCVYHLQNSYSRAKGEKLTQTTVRAAYHSICGWASQYLCRHLHPQSPSAATVPSLRTASGILPGVSCNEQSHCFSPILGTKFNSEPKTVWIRWARFRIFSILYFAGLSLNCQ